MNDHDDYPFKRPGHLNWLAAHGLCYPETAAEYVGRELLSQELFARARKEYQEVTRNYAPAYYPDFLGKFTLRKVLLAKLISRPARTTQGYSCPALSTRGSSRD
jgi:hypothetical protein